MFIEINQNRNVTKGWIEVICGSMFSGKTEELIRRLRRAEIANQQVAIFKPQIDNRYSDKLIVSHDNNSVTSVSVKMSADILPFTTSVEVVGIDEAQFFDAGLVDVCMQLANSGIRVIVAGLDTDFRTEPFGPIPHLLAVAEFVTKVHAICVVCGQLAQYSYRFGQNDDKILIGAGNEYQPLCRTCYINKPMKRP